MPEVETVHVEDEGTVIYIDVKDQAISIDGDLDDYTTRTVKIKRPGNSTLITITSVTTEVDSDDSVRKLKLVLGTDAGTSLTGTGGFEVSASDLGNWIAEILLGKATGQWTSNPFRLFKLHRNLS